MAEPYRPHGRKIAVTKPAPPTNRADHGKALERALKAAVALAKTRRDEAGILVHGAVPGLYVSAMGPEDQGEWAKAGSNERPAASASAAADHEVG